MTKPKQLPGINDHWSDGSLGVAAPDALKKARGRKIAERKAQRDD